MSDSAVFTATGSSYANSESWADSKQKNPVYLGTNSSGSNKYIGQFIFPPISGGGNIAKIELSLYRTSDSGNYSRVLYYGCSDSMTDSGSVLSTGETVELTGGEGWKMLDVSAIKDTAKDYTEDWALLLGNPNTKSTYCAVAGYGSGDMPFLIVHYDNGSKVYYAATAAATTAGRVYYAATSSSAAPCNVYIATSSSTLQKI